MRKITQLLKFTILIGGNRFRKAWQKLSKTRQMHTTIKRRHYAELGGNKFRKERQKLSKTTQMHTTIKRRHYAELLGKFTASETSQ